MRAFINEAFLPDSIKSAIVISENIALYYNKNLSDVEKKEIILSFNSLFEMWVEEQPEKTVT